MVKFVSVHKTTNGSDIRQSQIRFYLADSADDALNECMKILKNPFYFDGLNNRVDFQTVNSSACPEAHPWPGYARFGMDIRIVKMSDAPDCAAPNRK